MLSLSPCSTLFYPFQPLKLLLTSIYDLVCRVCFCVGENVPSNCHFHFLSTHVASLPHLRRSHHRSGQSQTSSSSSKLRPWLHLLRAMAQHRRLLHCTDVQLRQSRFHRPGQLPMLLRRRLATIRLRQRLRHLHSAPLNRQPVRVFRSRR